METGVPMRISPQGIKKVGGAADGGQFKNPTEGVLFDPTALPSIEDEATVSRGAGVEGLEKDRRGPPINVVELAEIEQPSKETIKTTATASGIPTTILMAPEGRGPDLMIPTNAGKIKHLLMTYDGKGNGYVELFKTLAEHMPEARFTVLTKGEAARKELDAALQDLDNRGKLKEPGRFNIRATDRDISIWAQDSILVQGRTLIVPDRSKYAFSDKGDAFVADLVAEANPEFRVLRSQGLFIDGGNEIASSEFLVVGSDALRHFAHEDLVSYPRKEYIIKGNPVERIAGEDEEDLARRIIQTRFPSQKLIIMGSRSPRGNMEQPALHIDFGSTLLRNDPETGKPVVVIGNPSAAIQILAEQKEKDPEGYREIVEKMRSKLNPPGKNDPDPLDYAPYYGEEDGGPVMQMYESLMEKRHYDPLEVLLDAVNADPRFQERFDRSAEDFEEKGFLVERIPYLGTANIFSSLEVPWITYNNVLIDDRKVFMPTYGIPKLDDAARKVYEKRGYEVITADMAAISGKNGAINCATKVLERELP